MREGQSRERACQGVRPDEVPRKRIEAGRMTRLDMSCLPARFRPASARIAAAVPG